MKYRNLKLSFTIENVRFQVLSIGLEKMHTPIPRHSHSKNSYELHYISYGYGTLIADEKEYDIIPGTFFMTGPGVFHEQISKPEDPMTEYGVYLQISFTTPTEKPMGLMEKFLAQKFWIGPADNSIHELMKQIHAELENQTAGYELMLPSLLQQLLLMITRGYLQSEYTEKEQTSQALLLQPNDQTYLTIEEAFLYNYRDLTLEQLAEQVHLGKRQTERLLQKKTEARMSAACILLQDANVNIASVAYELGYSSSEHFTNAFKKFYHMTPSAYRRSAGV